MVEFWGFGVWVVFFFFFLSDCNWGLCYGCHNSPHWHSGNLTWNSFCGSLLICGRVQGSELFCAEAYLEVGNQLKILFNFSSTAGSAGQVVNPRSL